MSETILQEAQRLIHGDRNEAYGHPLDNHSTTAVMMTAFLRRKYGACPDLDAEDVCWFNVLQKVSREANQRKRDSLVDIAGYTGNVEMIQEERARRGLTGHGRLVGEIDASPSQPGTGLDVPRGTQVLEATTLDSSG